METAIINNHKIEIFQIFDGQEVFVKDADGNQVYSARLAKNADAIARAKMFIPNAPKAEVVNISAKRIQNAKAKALKVLLTNNTLEYVNGVASFISSESKKQRKVTKYGCHHTCDCRGLYSYHTEVFNLVSERENNIRQFGHTGICELCGYASRNGELHTGCVAEEEYYADRLAA